MELQGFTDHFWSARPLITRSCGEK